MMSMDTHSESYEQIEHEGPDDAHAILVISDRASDIYSAWQELEQGWDDPESFPEWARESGELRIFSARELFGDRFAAEEYRQYMADTRVPRAEGHYWLERLYGVATIQMDMGELDPWVGGLVMHEFRLDSQGSYHWCVLSEPSDDSPQRFARAFIQRVRQFMEKP